MIPPRVAAIRFKAEDELPCFACGKPTRLRCELPLESAVLDRSVFVDGVLTAACTTHHRDYAALCREAASTLARGWERSTTFQTTVVPDEAPPVIFLGIEGVLACDAYLQQRRSRKQPVRTIADGLSPQQCARVHRLATSTGADLVLMSQWLQLRSETDIRRALRDRGIKARILGRIEPPAYGEGILAWLYRHPRCKRWVALHEHDLGGPAQHGLVRCEGTRGISEHDVRLAVARLAPVTAARRAS